MNRRISRMAELTKELLRQNEDRFKVGALPRTSVLESEAEVARREADLVRSRALQRWQLAQRSQLAQRRQLVRSQGSARSRA